MQRPCVRCEELGEGLAKVQRDRAERYMARWSSRCDQNTQGLKDHGKDLSLHPPGASFSSKDLSRE